MGRAVKANVLNSQRILKDLLALCYSTLHIFKAASIYDFLNGKGRDRENENEYQNDYKTYPKFKSINFTLSLKIDHCRIYFKYITWKLYI